MIEAGGTICFSRRCQKASKSFPKAQRPGAASIHTCTFTYTKNLRDIAVVLMLRGNFLIFETLKEDFDVPKEFGKDSIKKWQYEGLERWLSKEHLLCYPRTCV